jgi:CubicO group peptidase (beta-lactamase class C family)
VLLSGDQAIEQLQFRTFTPRALIAIGLSQPPTNAPGEGWSYSNTNYIIAGLLIERLTGRPYAREISRRILRPLGLRHTSFPGTDRRDHTRSVFRQADVLVKVVPSGLGGPTMIDDGQAVEQTAMAFCGGGGGHRGGSMPWRRLYGPARREYRRAAAVDHRGWRRL